MLGDFVSPRHPPLTRDELRDVWTRNRSADVRDLLWEIARLRNVVLHSHHHAERFQHKLSGNMEYESWIQSLMNEPCIIEAFEADYGSLIPGSRGQRGEVRPPEHEERLAEMRRASNARIAERQARSRR
ncbi:hypothetical protein K2O51_23220 [Cupriavidus pinatubonensis]|uniref:hypothetical protein n=1 Tax=Cupriavidus pinatubonensis TaxID=248026 RepID=UPI001C72D03F|nr:hypothetical protein [Cupriavidus pinatubonensis]QYY30284.1 hypothetical protein K2O51_23220 [Cupriavidus pinatubonensis]